MNLIKNVAFFLSLLCFSQFSYADAIDINQADADAIASALQGIGLKKAEAIVEYRQQNGPYRSIEELAQVKGIGARTLEINLDRIVIQEASAAEEKQ